MLARVYLLDAGEVPRLSLAGMRRLTSRALPWRAWAALIHSAALVETFRGLPQLATVETDRLQVIAARAQPEH